MAGFGTGIPVQETFNPFGNGTTGTGDARSTSNTYHTNPELVNQTSGALGGLQTALAGQYQGLLQNPTAHPLYQAQINGLLQSLQPSEDRARSSLTDTFRAAGGLRSGAYGREAGMLEGDILGRRQQTASQLLGQMFPQLMQALQQPLGQTSSLIDAMKLSQSQGAASLNGGSSGGSAGWDAIPPSMGLNTQMGSSTMPTTMSPQQLEWQKNGYGMNTTIGPNAPGMNGNPVAGGGTSQPPPYTPYKNPWESGGGNSIVFNPYTGSYETTMPTPTNPYEHTYGEWQDAGPAQPGEYY